MASSVGPNTGKAATDGRLDGAATVGVADDKEEADSDKANEEATDESEDGERTRGNFRCTSAVKSSKSLIKEAVLLDGLSEANDDLDGKTVDDEPRDLEDLFDADFRNA